MRYIRAVSVAVLTVAAVMTPLVTTVRSALTLTATALYMGGTDHPLSIPDDIRTVPTAASSNGSSAGTFQSWE